MKTLIKHLLTHNLEEIVKKSLLNCHCLGVHSIMLLDCPGKTIRLYVADIGNELYKNEPGEGHKLSIAFHPHHCDLTIEVLRGGLGNWIVEHTGNVASFVINKYFYHSKIKEDKIGFEQLRSVFLRTKAINWYGTGESFTLKATDIHTVFCDTNKVTAWLVYEGKEDPNYIPYSYSDADLENQSFEGLYTKPNKEDVLRLLDKIF